MRVWQGYQSSFFTMISDIEFEEGNPLGEATRRSPNPKKPTHSARSSWGLGPQKAVIASRAVTVHASTLLTPSQELAARA